MATLAELRARQGSSRPTRTVRVCLDLEVLANIQRLAEEKNDLEMQRGKAAEASGDSEGKPKRIADAQTPRLVEIDAELSACYERMQASEGELLLRSVTAAEWQRFKDDNPPREDNQSDEINAYGYCSATALMADLARYAVAWDGEDFADGDWTWFVDRMAPGDVNNLLRTVVEMHEARVKAPKALTSTSTTPTPEPA